MVGTGPLAVVEPLSGDPLAYAQCLALDASIFPHPSVPLLTSPEAIWVARDEASRAVVGFASTIKRGVLLDVVGLAVVPEFRRRGFGRALLRAVFERARKARVRVVSLHVSCANEGAIALYESEGFSRVRRMSRFYSPAHFAQGGDAYEMRAVLDGPNGR